MSETTSTTGTQTLSLQSETVDPSNTGDPSETTVTAPAADTTDAALSARVAGLEAQVTDMQAELVKADVIFGMYFGTSIAVQQNVATAQAAADLSDV
jgi:hypothetical protein